MGKMADDRGVKNASGPNGLGMPRMVQYPHRDLSAPHQFHARLVPGLGRGLFALPCGVKLGACDDVCLRGDKLCVEAG
jgi:hypothetical protein